MTNYSGLRFVLLAAFAANPQARAEEPLATTVHLAFAPKTVFREGAVIRVTALTKSSPSPAGAAQQPQNI